jgi:tRNA pseudouridine55 synthase
MRRALSEPRIGHTGTLDPAATGVLPLVLGRATRLARFLTATTKSYTAVICLGSRTTTGDAEGDRIGPVHSGPWPSPEAIDAALDAFRGTFRQQPPAFSAKRIGGQRSYRLARRAVPVRPHPATVTAHRLHVDEVSGGRVALRIDCSAGFYVRSLADDLGERLGTGAHLESLRRTASGEFTLADAIGLDTAERQPVEAARWLIPPARLLTRLASVTLSGEGLRRARHGRDLGPADWVRSDGGRMGGSERCDRPDAGSAGVIRLLDQRGDLVGLAEPASVPGFLHPAVVLM